jgi:hypothetical protein
MNIRRTKCAGGQRGFLSFRAEEIRDGLALFALQGIGDAHHQSKVERTKNSRRRHFLQSLARWRAGTHLIVTRRAAFLIHIRAGNCRGILRRSQLGCGEENGKKRRTCSDLKKKLCGGPSVSHPVLPVIAFSTHRVQGHRVCVRTRIRELLVAPPFRVTFYMQADARLKAGATSNKSECSRRL